MDRWLVLAVGLVASVALYFYAPEAGLAGVVATGAAFALTPDAPDAAPVRALSGLGAERGGAVAVDRSPPNAAGVSPPDYPSVVPRGVPPGPYEDPSVLRELVGRFPDRRFAAEDGLEEQWKYRNDAAGFPNVAGYEVHDRFIRVGDEALAGEIAPTLIPRDPSKNTLRNVGGTGTSKADLVAMQAAAEFARVGAPNPPTDELPTAPPGVGRGLRFPHRDQPNHFGPNVRLERDYSDKLLQTYAAYSKSSLNADVFERSVLTAMDLPEPLDAREAQYRMLAEDPKLRVDPYMEEITD